jgi:hypothetical protein
LIVTTTTRLARKRDALIGRHLPVVFAGRERLDAALVNPGADNVFFIAVPPPPPRIVASPCVAL